MTCAIRRQEKKILVPVQKSHIQVEIKFSNVMTKLKNQNELRHSQGTFKTWCK